MSAQNSRNNSNSAPKGSDDPTTPTPDPLYRSIWERLHVARQRVADTNGISKDEAEAAICHAVRDGGIGIRGCLQSHASTRMTSKAELDGSAFEIPTALEPRHLDWDASRPTKAWVVKRGAYKLPGRWYLAWIALYKSGVTRLLCTAQGDGCAEDASEQRSTALRSSKTVPTRPRGPRAKKLQATIEAMKNDIRQELLTEAELDGMPEKILSARYGVSRDTARKARNVVLSEFVEL